MLEGDALKKFKYHRTSGGGKGKSKGVVVVEYSDGDGDILDGSDEEEDGWEDS